MIQRFATRLAASMTFLLTDETATIETTESTYTTALGLCVSNVDLLTANPVSNARHAAIPSSFRRTQYDAHAS
jgi:hypothetical protein